MNLPGVKTAVPDALARLVERNALPPPVSVDLAADPVVVRMRTPADVQAWAKVMRAGIARRWHVAGEGTGLTFTLIHVVGCLVRLEADGTE